jgi:hypothetical protein
MSDLALDGQHTTQDSELLLKPLPDVLVTKLVEARIEEKRASQTRR